MVDNIVEHGKHPIRQRIVATAIAGVIGAGATVGAIINKGGDQPERSQTQLSSEVLYENMNIYPRESNSRIQNWETKVYDLLKNKADFVKASFKLKRIRFKV